MGSPCTTVGPYRLVRKLGEGGMGEVYEAVHQTIERQVAIKFLRPRYARSREMNRRFINEARAVSLINHPGLVQISDFGALPSGSRYIVMEYLRGETLGQRLKRHDGRLPLPQVLHILWQVASALVAAHAKGIVHRDLKPDNIMLVHDSVTPTGERAKLLDFGIARLDLETADADDPGSPARTYEQILGTPSYMSPEQCRGAGAIDAKSDVYSLGVMLYELAAGRPPFVSKAPGELINLHLSRLPDPLTALAPAAPPELAALVHQLLAKDPTERPTMLQVVAALERLQARQGSAGGPGLLGPVEPPLTMSTADARLGDSLGEILGQPAEQRGSAATPPAQAAQQRVYEPTLGSGPYWRPRLSADSLDAELPTPEAMPAAVAQTTPPTVVLEPPAMIPAPPSIPTAKKEDGLHPRPSMRWSLAVGVLLGGASVAASAWVFLPSRAAPLSSPRLPLSTTAPDPRSPVSPASPLRPPEPAAPPAKTQAAADTAPVGVMRRSRPKKTTLSAHRAAQPDNRTRLSKAPQEIRDHAAESFEIIE